MPRTPVCERAEGSQCDSWYAIAAKSRQFIWYSSATVSSSGCHSGRSSRILRWKVSEPTREACSQRPKCSRSSCAICPCSVARAMNSFTSSSEVSPRLPRGRYQTMGVLSPISIAATTRGNSCCWILNSIESTIARSAFSSVTNCINSSESAA